MNQMWPSEPYLLFDTRDTFEARVNRGSVVNLFEVCLILSLLKCFISMNPGTTLQNIAVITPYREQKDLIEQTLRATFKRSSSFPSVSTVDGFQGKECEFVIVSCVRATNNIGFLSDAQRLNVALTRAKKRCWILGIGIVKQRQDLEICCRRCCFKTLHNSGPGVSCNFAKLFKSH